MQVQRQPFWEPVARNDKDRDGGSRKEGLSIIRPIVSFSAIINVDKDTGIQYTVAVVWKNKGPETKQPR